MAKELPRIALRVEKKDGPRRGSQTLQEPEEQRGLAHSRLGDQRHEAAAGLDAVKQRRQRLPVGRAEIQVVWTRSDTERLFTQPVVLQEHVSPSGQCKRP